MIIMGLDASLNGTGIATSEGCSKVTHKLVGPERLRFIRDTVREVILREGIELVVMEGYSYASTGRAVIGMGELGGVLRVMFYEEKIPFVEVAPGTLKKFATGSGNAQKGIMLGEAIRRLDYSGGSDDEADALWLFEAGQHIYNRTTDQWKVPQSRVAELFDKVEWPGQSNSGSKIKAKGAKKKVKKES